MKNYVQDGDKITVTAHSGAVSGQGLKVGKLFGVAAATASAGVPVTMVRKGVYTHAKAGSQAWVQGEALYWDDVAKVFTTNDGSGTNDLVAAAVQAAAEDDATGIVVLI